MALQWRNRQSKIRGVIGSRYLGRRDHQIAARRAKENQARDSWPSNGYSLITALFTATSAAIVRQRDVNWSPPCEIY
ncbi:MAG: hypothetical protein ACYCW5_04015 [Thermoleophilia bacterium]